MWEIQFLLYLVYFIIADARQISAEGARRHRSPSALVSITQHFEDRILSPGGDVSMQCTTHSNFPSNIVWKQDGSVVTPNTNQRYTLGQVMIDNGVIGQLNITRVRVEDGGLYTCEAVSVNNMTILHSARLNVYGPPYIRPAGPVKVISGEDVDIGCPYYGFPISDITWELNGKSLSSEQYTRSKARFRRTNGHIEHSIGNDKYPSKGKHLEEIHKRNKRKPAFNEGGILRIENVDVQHNGAVYTCIVRSPSGEMARRGIEIQVMEPPVLEDMLFPPNLQEGQIAQVVCSLRSGDTPVFFAWYKDGNPVSTNLKVEERSSDLFSVLVIRKVALEHCGSYTCVATNHAAKVNKSAELFIKVAPKWLHEPQNISFLQGSVGSVPCTANGYPQPQVHWMKKNYLSGIWQPVLDLVGRGYLSLPNGSLVIDAVSPEDEGFYSCRVENGVGSPLSKTIWMNVNVPVNFDPTTANVTSRLGHPVNLVCQAYGDSPIHITWTHNGSPISKMSHRIKIIESPNERSSTSNAVVQYSDVVDSGLYQCKASNPHGTAIYSIHLHIQEPPSPPSDLIVDSVGSRSTRLSWSAPSQKHYIFSVQYIQQKHYVVSWENPLTVNVTTKYENSRQFVDLNDLQPSMTYSARVSAGNSEERSAFSTPISFTTPEEEPSLPPTLILVDQTTNPGELKVSWLPPPKESWNGDILGYYVTVIPKVENISDTNTKVLKVLSRNNLASFQMETVISNLLKSTRYAVTVKAYNSAGLGPNSVPVLKETKEGAPESAPNSIECHSVTSTSIRVHWKEIPFTEQGGSLLGYSIVYNNDDGSCLNITTLHSEVTLHGLAKYSNYSIKVSGYSNYGVGPFSLPVICTTAQDVPGPPADIKALATTPSSLLISWKRPQYANGIITHYNINIKPTISSSHPISYRVPAPVNDSSLWQEVRSLSQDTRYEVWVTASTLVGDGEPSRRVYAAPTGRVVAGIYSLGGTVSAGVGGSLLLTCQAIGSPQPRTVWYHNQNIITHHPRYTLNDENSLSIDNIDQSLSGNYTCLAKNLYGADSVSYVVNVVPLPEPPQLQTFPSSDSITLEWTQPVQYNPVDHSRIIVTGYHISWKDLNPSWSDEWSPSHNKRTGGDVTIPSKSARESSNLYVISGLKCGSTYALTITTSSRDGTSQPTTTEVSTLGGEPIPPKTTDWFWSNSSHVLIQISGWEDNGCEIHSWLVDYRQFYTKLWLRAENKLVFMDLPIGWLRMSDHASGVRSKANTFVVGNLPAAHWYQFRIKASNDAGSVTTHYSYATKTIMGAEIDPPYDYFDLIITVLLCIGALLFVMMVACVILLVKRNRHVVLCSDSTYKSETANVMSVAVSRDTLDIRDRQDSNRVYSSPINVRKSFKNGTGEVFEISPYAQFRMDFRTFGNMENQARPSFEREKGARCNAETSFQEVSESDDSDSISKTMTLKNVAARKRDKLR